MPKNKATKESGQATLALVKKEMAKARVAKSAQKKYANLVLSGRSAEAEKPSSSRNNWNSLRRQSVEEAAKLN
jgi:hypothetical protein